MMPTPNETPTLACASPDEWEAWLADHHATAAAVWLRIAKRRSPAPLISLSDALDVALCFGWIDSDRRGFDGESYVQRYSPRRPRSSWSQINVDRVAELTAAGRLRPPGLAAVRAAQADGRWAAAYAPQREFVVPPDLARALADDARARERFDALTRSEQYGLVLRLTRVRTPAGREACLRRIVTRLGRPAARRR